MGGVCMSGVVMEDCGVSLQVGCHAVMCVEVRHGHWMWDQGWIW